MARRALLNCWLVAMWLWLASLGHRRRRYIFTRLSYAFRGKVPHFGAAEAPRWKLLTVVEFIPIKAEFGTRRNWLVLFRGRYRVWRLRVDAVRRFDSRAEALAFAYWGTE